VSRTAAQDDKTTVYRALDLLSSSGLSSNHRCADGRAQYDPRPVDGTAICCVADVVSCRTWIRGLSPRSGAGLHARHGFFTPT